MTNLFLVRYLTEAEIAAEEVCCIYGQGALMVPLPQEKKAESAKQLVPRYMRQTESVGASASLARLGLIELS